MDLRTSAINSALESMAAARKMMPASVLESTAAPRTAPIERQAAPGFATALQGALESVSASQHRSTLAQQQVQLENPKVSIEETMVAMQKSQIAFQATVQVRNRLVQAYTDVMNMQV